MGLKRMCNVGPTIASGKLSTGGIPTWDGVYCLVPGTPLPPFARKIFKTKD